MIWQNLTISFFVIIICSSSRAFSEIYVFGDQSSYWNIYKIMVFPELDRIQKNCDFCSNLVRVLRCPWFEQKFTFFC